MTEQDRPSDIEAPEIEPQDRFISPDQPEDDATRLTETEPDPALDEEPDDRERGSRRDEAEDRVDEESEQSFPASDPPPTDGSLA